MVLKRLIIGTMTVALLISCTTAQETAEAEAAVDNTASKIVFEVQNEPHTTDLDGTEVQVENPDEKVCRTERVSGSLFKKEVCKTKAQWAVLEEQGRKIATEIQNDGRYGS